MNEVFQKLIDRTRAPLDLVQMKTIFGRSHRPHHGPTRGRATPELVKLVHKKSYDLTVFKVHFGKLTLKAYTPASCAAARCWRSCRSCWSA